MKSIIFYIGLLLVLICNMKAAKASSEQSIFDHLGFAEIVHADIEVDWDALTANIRNQEKHRALLSFKNENGIQENWDIQIKLRGKFRRMYCETPPMKLFFDKTDLKAAGLAKYNDFKLVNYCLSDPVQAKKLIIKEYMAYKMFNDLAAESYRVQMLKLTFKDTKTNRRIRQWAFMIEDTALLRNRVKAQKVKLDPDGTVLDIDQKSSIKVALFQYMIGNSDWMLQAQKNIKLIEKNGKIIPVPYDFDFSGLVNPVYGIPNPNYNHQSMEDRVFLGDTLALKQSDIDFFNKRKAHIYQLIKDNHFVRKHMEKEMLEYLDSFFQHLDYTSIVAASPNTELTSIHTTIVVGNEQTQQ